MAKNNGIQKRFVFFIFFLTLFLAVIISVFIHLLLTKIVSIYLSFLLLLVIILIGIIFDIIGIAATAANEVPFHAKAAKRVTGAGHTIKLIRNADKVANFANDVVGDISGTVSGALGASIIFQILLSHPTTFEIYLETFMTAMVAAVTVTGKAIGKGYAIREANKIIFSIGKLWAVLEEPMAFFAKDKNVKRGN